MELKYILESILFASQEPLSPKELRDLLATTAEQSDEAQPFKKIPLAEIDAALAALEREHGQAQRSYRLACVAGSWQFFTEPEYAPWIKALVGQTNRPARLSQPALETLAIIAYRQPITRAEIEEVRGVTVNPDIVRTLFERNWIRVVGHREVPGRPELLGTTREFLDYFALKSLDDLPTLAELRDMDNLGVQLELPGQVGEAQALDATLRTEAADDGGLSMAADDESGDDEDSTPGTPQAAGMVARGKEGVSG